MKVKCKECGKEFEKRLADIKRTCNNFCCLSCSGKYNGRKRHGPHKSSEPLYRRARQLRSEGYGYRTIAKMIDGSHYSTVRYWVQDIPVDPVKAHRLACRRMRMPIEQLTSSGAVRHRLVEERGHRCESCGLDVWMGKPIPLEAHHIDGNTQNNCRDNVKILCPNCHSQTPDWRSHKSYR